MCRTTADLALYDPFATSNSGRELARDTQRRPRQEKPSESGEEIKGNDGRTQELAVRRSVMPIARDAMTRGPAGAPIIGALGAIGLVFSMLALRQSKHRTPRPDVDKRRAFAAYLRDHLTGADAAIRMVERLREAKRGSLEGALFASLYDQFCEERAVVEALLAALGASPVSMKRLAGRAAGAALKTADDGEPRDLSLFRRLEALAIGVQGKRCLWRAAQALPSSLPAPGRRTFRELEADAVSQWEAIEQYRLSTVPRTFAQ
jgi:hypothetical protein